MDRDQALKNAMSRVGRTPSVMVIYPNYDGGWSVVAYEDYDRDKVKDWTEVRFVLERYEVLKLS